jgi:hypothetical protein
MAKRKAENELNDSNGYENGNVSSQAIKGEEMKGLGGTTDLPSTDEPHTKHNAWSGPGPAAFDFRSTSSFPSNRLSIHEF